MTGAVRFLRIAGIAARNARRFRLQSTLVVFAACLGVASVLVSEGYASGGRQKILDRFYRLGTNLIIVTPRQSRAVGGRARTGTNVQTLDQSDYRAVKEQLDGLSASSATAQAVFRIRANDLTKTATIIGCEPDYFRIKHWTAVSGDIFGAPDMRRQARVVLLGYSAAKDLFGATDPTGRRVTVNREPFVVVGVLSERGQGLDAANEDEQAYVPLPAAMHRLMNVDYYSSIVFEVADQAQMDSSVAMIASILHHRHRRFSPTADDFQVQNQKSLIDTQLATFQRLSFLIGWIASSALFVSGLGILGITWIGVRTRAKEIGARRALGATRTDVLSQFLIEALLGAAMGCALGVTVGYIGVYALDRMVDQPFIVGAPAIISAMAGAAVLFLASIVFTAGKAASLDPIASLRAE